jgi:hypothetical protein
MDSLKFPNLKNWHIALLIVLVVIGGFCVIFGMITAIMWLIQHVQIV